MLEGKEGISMVTIDGRRWKGTGFSKSVEGGMGI